MARADAFLTLVDDPTAPAPKVGDHPADDVLMDILVHMACSDGLVQEEEFEFLQKVLPDRDASEILFWVSERAALSLDLTSVSEDLEGREERLGALRFAVRLAWADRVLDPEEKELLQELVLALELSNDDLEGALAAVVGFPSGDVSPDRVRAAIESTAFRTAELDRSELLAELKEVVPDGVEPVARLLLDGVEQLGLYDRGIAANFDEGARFLPWDDVAAYTRVPVLGATVRVMTVTGEALTVSDPRLRDVSDLLDKVYT